MKLISVEIVTERERLEVPMPYAMDIDFNLFSDPHSEEATYSPQTYEELLSLMYSSAAQQSLERGNTSKFFDLYEEKDYLKAGEDSKLLIKINFMSKQDLTSLVGEDASAFTLRRKVYFCEKTDSDHNFGNDPGIFWEGINVGYAWHGNFTISNYDYYSYSAFISINEEQNAKILNDKGKTHEYYDLSVNPKNICFSVIQEGMLKRQESNTLTISAEMILEALQAWKEGSE